MSFNVIRFFGTVDWLILLVVVALVHALLVVCAGAFRAEREKIMTAQRISEGRA